MNLEHRALEEVVGEWKEGEVWSLGSGGGRVGEWKRPLAKLEVRTGLKPYINLIRCVTLTKLCGSQVSHL